LILYSRGKPLVADIHARREARTLLSTFNSQKSLVLSLFEWADKFGGNIIPLSIQLTKLEDDVEGTTARYLDQEYQHAISMMDSIAPRIIKITEEAIEAKDQALIWIYLSEWLAVTSTAVISGIIV
jgi:hypothetical protein